MSLMATHNTFARKSQVYSKIIRIITQIFIYKVKYSYTFLLSLLKTYKH